MLSCTACASDTVCQCRSRRFCWRKACGGSAANAGHAVNDFRKIGGLECYAPTDNVSELTARTNDEGWATVFAEWLRGSRLRKEDALLVLSVGGGNLEKNVSPNLVLALQLAKQVGARVIGIVGKDIHDTNINSVNGKCSIRTASSNTVFCIDPGIGSVLKGQGFVLADGGGCVVVCNPRGLGKHHCIFAAHGSGFP